MAVTSSSLGGMSLVAFSEGAGRVGELRHVRSCVGGAARGGLGTGKHTRC